MSPARIKEWLIDLLSIIAVNVPSHHRVPITGPNSENLVAEDLVSRVPPWVTEKERIRGQRVG